MCAAAKFVIKNFKPVTNRVSELLELIHTDLADLKGFGLTVEGNMSLIFLRIYVRKQE